MRLALLCGGGGDYIYEDIVYFICINTFNNYIILIAYRIVHMHVYGMAWCVSIAIAICVCIYIYIYVTGVLCVHKTTHKIYMKYVVDY